LEDQRRRGVADKDTINQPFEGGLFNDIVGIKRLAPDGTELIATVLYSFDDAAPFLLLLQIEWSENSSP
jgi:hypothetical protein